MYVRLCVCVCIYIYIYIYIHAHTYVFHAHIHTDTCHVCDAHGHIGPRQVLWNLNTHRRSRHVHKLCPRTQTPVQTHTHTHTQKTQTHTHIHTYIHKHTQTHTHTHTCACPLCRCMWHVHRVSVTSRHVSRPDHTYQHHSVFSGVHSNNKTDRSSVVHALHWSLLS